MTQWFVSLHYVSRITNSFAGILLKTTCEIAFSKISTRSQLLNLVKESQMPYNFKVEIFKRCENGFMTQFTNALEEYVSTKVKMCASIVWLCLGLVLDLLMVPFHDLKSSITILSWMTFYMDVLQERNSLVDNVPLNRFLIILSAIYISCLLLKQATAFTLTLPKGNAKIRKCLLWFPFVVECCVYIRSIKETVGIHTLRAEISEETGRLEATSEQDEMDKLVKSMFRKSEEVNEKLKKLEAFSFEAKALAITACVSDLLQVVYISHLLFSIPEQISLVNNSMPILALS